MPKDSETTTIVYRPLKWIEKSKRHPVVNQYIGDTLIKSMTSPESLNRTRRRIFVSELNGGVHKYIDPREKEYQEKKDKENAALENRRNILVQHDLLLSENQSWQEQSEGFKAFYSQHKVQFEKIQALGDIFKQEESFLVDTDKNLWTTNIRIKNTAARKEGFFSNIKFHLNHADENWHRSEENYIRSMAIALTPLGIGIMVLGGIVLIPTIFTFLLPLPLAVIALGAILTATALILAHIDQQEAVKMHQTLEESIPSLLTKKENHASSLLETWKEIEAIDFEPTTLSMV